MVGIPKTLNKGREELCPHCGRAHCIETFDDRAKYVLCECGFYLRCVVPFFKGTDSGYAWIIVGADRAVPVK